MIAYVMMMLDDGRRHAGKGQRGDWRARTISQPMISSTFSLWLLFPEFPQFPRLVSKVNIIFPRHLHLQPQRHDSPLLKKVLL